MEDRLKKYVECTVIKFDASVFMIEDDPECDPMAETIQRELDDIENLYKFDIINITCVVTNGIIVHTIFYSYWAHL